MSIHEYLNGLQLCTSAITSTIHIYTWVFKWASIVYKCYNQHNWLCRLWWTRTRRAASSCCRRKSSASKHSSFTSRRLQQVLLPPSQQAIQTLVLLLRYHMPQFCIVYSCLCCLYNEVDSVSVWFILVLFVLIFLSQPFICSNCVFCLFLSCWKFLLFTLVAFKLTSAMFITVFFNPLTINTQYDSQGIWSAFQHDFDFYTATI